MRILIVWEPYPDAQIHEDGYQDSRQMIMKDDFRRVDDFAELTGKRIKDVRRNEQDDIIFELEEATYSTRIVLGDNAVLEDVTIEDVIDVEEGKGE